MTQNNIINSPYPYPTDKGGTGKTTWAAFSLVYATSANVLGELAAVANSVLTTDATGAPVYLELTDGQIIIGSSSGAPLAATLTQGTNMTITNAPNAITIATTALSQAQVLSRVSLGV